MALPFLPHKKGTHKKYSKLRQEKQRGETGFFNLVSSQGPLSLLSLGTMLFNLTCFLSDTLNRTHGLSNSAVAEHTPCIRGIERELNPAVEGILLHLIGVESMRTVQLTQWAVWALPAIIKASFLGSQTVRPEE